MVFLDETQMGISVVQQNYKIKAKANIAVNPQNVFWSN